MTHKEDILTQAGVVLREREAVYGNPCDTFREIATRWSTTLGAVVTAEEVALCMIDLKLARLRATRRHADSLLDLIGYAACLYEIIMENRE